MSEHAIEREPSRVGRWLAARRLQLALTIAAIEGLVVLFSASFS